jgi:hypothetical protein
MLVSNEAKITENPRDIGRDLHGRVQKLFVPVWCPFIVAVQECDPLPSGFSYPPLARPGYPGIRLPYDPNARPVFDRHSVRSTIGGAIIYNEHFINRARLFQYAVDSPPYIAQAIKRWNYS